MAIGNIEGIGRWASGSVRWKQYDIEHAAGLDRSDLDLRFPLLDVRRYGADVTGVRSSQSAIEVAVATASQANAAGEG